MTDSTVPGTRFVHGSSDTILAAFVEGLEEMGITQIKIPTSAYTVLSHEPLVLQVPIRFSDLTIGEVPWNDALDSARFPTAASVEELTSAYFVQDLVFDGSHQANRWSYTDAFYHAGDAHRLGTFKYEHELYLSIGEVFTPPTSANLVTS
jgi:hypothetical protein